MLKEKIDNPKLVEFIKKAVDLCTPDSVHLCDGSKEEYESLCNLLEKEGKAIRLNSKKRPNSFYFRSHKDDVARVEEATFICTEEKKDAGPNNNWKDPKEMISQLNSLFKGCMKGRKMYIIPFCMGPLDSEMSIFGVQITDSEYVVCNMRIMSRMGKKALSYMKDKDFIPCLHSVGVPKEDKNKKEFWPCNPKKRCIAHFPETKSIYSYGSGYGGNALLGKKCLGLRIASFAARKEKWFAEHMLILKITNPEGKVKYMAAAFPSACGKTNLAMMKPSLKGWKIECVGDDIAWMRFYDKKLYAINPEAGFFGVAPGTSENTNPNAIETLKKDVLFTNVALTKENDVWWEGLSKRPDKVISWLGNEGDEIASHPNARFTAPFKNCPIAAKEWDDPKGVPISCIIFGGKRSDVVPLVFEAFDWDHGVFLGASMSSEKTAAAKGKVGVLRNDPFAMLPFCGYNMGDYFKHWFSFKGKSYLPKIYHVNWFKKDKDGSFIWPGFGENIHILKWIFERIDGDKEAFETPVGNIPKREDLKNISLEKYEKLFEIDKEAFKKEIKRLEEYFSIFKDRLPDEIKIQMEKLKKRFL